MSGRGGVALSGKQVSVTGKTLITISAAPGTDPRSVEDMCIKGSASSVGDIRLDAVMGLKAPKYYMQLQL